MFRISTIHVPWPVLCLAAADVLILFVVITVGLIARYTSLESIFALGSPLLLQVCLFVSVNAFFLLVLGVFRRQTLTNLKTLTVAIFLSHLLSFVSLTVVFYALPSTRIWLSTLIPSLIVSLLGIVGIHYLFDRFIAFRRFRRRILVLGVGQSASRIHRFLRSGHAPMIHCVGFVPTGATPATVPEEEILRSHGSIPELVSASNADEVVVALDERRNQLPMEPLMECRLRGVQITNFSTFLEREEGRVELESLYPSWMIFASGFSAATRIQRFVKRMFDIAASVVVLAVTFPIIVASALAILVEDSGPVFYRQARIGLNGRSFNLVKFRSMRPDAEDDGQARWAEDKDPRTTAVGHLLRRTRIDELPQLYNVLRGEMSLIGPRPERPQFVEQLCEQVPYYNFRHSVKPGISGWAQINYPYGSSIEDSKEKLKYDLYYIKNYSLFLDLLVLLLTIRVVIWPERNRQVAAQDSESPATGSAD